MTTTGMSSTWGCARKYLVENLDAACRRVLAVHMCDDDLRAQALVSLDSRARLLGSRHDDHFEP